MDYVTLAISLGIFSLGAGAMYWPLSLKIKRLKNELKLAIHQTRDAQEAARAQAHAAKRLIDVEREILGARKLSPADELRWLLNTGDLEKTITPGETS